MQKGMSGPERAYLTRILDRGASIGSPVTITSMHRSKGLERRNVIICPDMVYRTARARDASQVGFEEENCVAYVAATRTLSTLIVLGVNDRNWYDYSRLVRQRG
jgi:superfamily I DNA/RNA helicase